MTPTTAPLDGVWLDDVWYYGGSERSVHRRTALAHPAATMHLPDPWRVVVAEASNTKYADYGMRNDASAYTEVLALHPRRVLAWLSFPTDATRFEFDG